jgi:hypothetical protein
MGEGLDIGEAIQEMRLGMKVARKGWNGKGMWLQFVPGGLALIHGGKEPIAMLPYIVMKTVSDQFVPWLCSQTDLLAQDWERV